MLMSQRNLEAQLQWLQDKEGVREEEILEWIRWKTNKGDITLDSALVLTKLVQKFSRDFAERTFRNVLLSPTSTPNSTPTTATTPLRDVYDISLTPPVKGWSEEIDLYNLKPFRYNAGFRVTDSIRVHFKDGREFVIGPNQFDKNLGNGPIIFRVQAFRPNTQVIAEAYNK